MIYDIMQLNEMLVPQLQTLAEELNNTIHMMNVEVDVESIASKYGALSNDELLENYRKDEE